MPNSMTGYGMADGAVGGGRLSIEVRTVNHRHFSAQLRLPQDLLRLENDLKTRIRVSLERGHATVVARWTEAPARPATVRIDLERARVLAEALQKLKDELGLSGDIDVGFLARQPDVLSHAEDEERGVAVTEVLAVLDRAMEDVVAMRVREGEALAADLEQRIANLEAGIATVEERAPHRVKAERDRLRAAVTELLDGRPMDENRLSQEIALLADKLDITEETVRLRTHCTAFREALQGSEAIGKRLAFLGQEMLREVNTIGSKANDAVIAQAVIAMKGELEKVREQVENIE